MSYVDPDKRVIGGVTHRSLHPIKDMLESAAQSQNRVDRHDRMDASTKSAPRRANDRGHGKEPIGGSMQAERTESANDGIFRRTARKEHRCTGCRRTIAVGESHIEDLNMARGAYQSGPRYCDACALDAGLLVHVSERLFRWWVVGWSYYEGSSRPWRQESHEGSVDAESLGAALDMVVTGRASDSIPWDLINQDREVTISVRPADDA